MTLIKCDYCGQRQEDKGVCKFCGAPLSETNHKPKVDSYSQFVSDIRNHSYSHRTIDRGGLGDWKTLSDYFNVLDYFHYGKTGIFVCPICGEKQEKQINHGESFCCDECGKQFIFYGNSLQKYGSGWGFASLGFKSWFKDR